MKTFSKVIKGIGTAAIVAILIIAILVLVYAMYSRITGTTMPKVMGWGYTVVISDSMGKEMPRNSVIFVKEQESYEPGDVVTYEDENGKLVTHRLMSIEGGIAITRGDVNNTDDKPFPEEKIQGKVRLTIAGLGGVLLAMQTPVGMLIVVIVFLLLWFQPWQMIGRKAKDRNGNKR